MQSTITEPRGSPMRTICLVALLFTFWASSASARDMRLTIYDDGIACPAGCDAHFVMNSSDNGTRYAFRPYSARDAPKVLHPQSRVHDLLWRRRPLLHEREIRRRRTFQGSIRFHSRLL